MLKTYTFFGLKVEVFHNSESWHPYPWRFRVHKQDGKTITFAGLPNQCETARSAMMRAYHRAKWISDGSYDKRYR